MFDILAFGFPGLREPQDRAARRSHSDVTVRLSLADGTAQNVHTQRKHFGSPFAAIAGD